MRSLESVEGSLKGDEDGNKEGSECASRTFALLLLAALTVLVYTLFPCVVPSLAVK